MNALKWTVVGICGIYAVATAVSSPVLYRIGRSQFPMNRCDSSRVTPGRAYFDLGGVACSDSSDILPP